jgi:hypothetical protein
VEEGEAMSHSIQLGESIQAQYLEPDPQPEAWPSDCGFANLLHQSVTLYIEAEKAHWHLRLNAASQPVHFESVDSVEIAREVCATSLRLISGISRLQKALHPKLSAECAALLATIGEKVAENRELAGERLGEFPEQAATLVFQGTGRVERTWRDTMRTRQINTGDQFGSLLEKQHHCS